MRLALMGQHWRVGVAPMDGLTTTSTTQGESYYEPDLVRTSE